MNSNVIHRYPLYHDRYVNTSLYLPAGAWSIVYVGVQHDAPQIWLRHFDPKQNMHPALCPPLLKYEFKIINTGEPFPEDWAHAGSFFWGDTLRHVIYKEYIDGEN